MSDTPTEDEQPEEPQAASWLASAIISVGILGVAGGLAAFTFMTEPTAKKSGATKKTAMLVDVVGVERGTYRPRIVAQGTVEPAREILLRPQVGGRVISIAEELTPGGFIEEGERLLTIESADFRHTLAQRRSDLRQAKSDLAVERGRHDAAEAEYDYVDEEISAENEALLLREPQLEAAKERVRAAEAAVEQAKLNLSRTTVEAPFDAHILRREVNVGSQIAPSDNIARLVGVDSYWVGVELPLSKLRWVSFAEGENAGSAVEIRNRQAWAKDALREGRLYKKVGALDDDTRMARVLASIPDPLARSEAAAGKPELTIGEYVEVTIHGNELEGVVRLSRDYVRKDDTVWVMEDGKLRIRDLDIATRDGQFAYVTGGLKDGARVVTSTISTVSDGAPLRTGPESSSSNGSEDGSE